jgi:P-type Ca2+ transporter type 2C
LDAPSQKHWHVLKLADIAQHWDTDLSAGHQQDDVPRLLETAGANKLAEKPPPSTLRRLIDQVADATVLALIAAAAAAAIIGYVQDVGLTFLEAYGDSVAIMVIVVLNALLGLAQEKKAERALEALKKMTSPRATVIRAGEAMQIDAAEVVPGDVLQLNAGDKVPADARLISASNLELTESALTGESFPVGKEVDVELVDDTALAERLNMVFMGTEVSRGRARAVVVNTGMYTELGQIAGMLARMEDQETPLRRYLNRFGKQIVIACVLISAVVFVAGMIQGMQTIRELFLTAVSLAVAAIPEGLPAITTIVLALGTQRMARRSALIKRLSAVEGLGSAQVICTDKTGTLTQNMMTVRRLHVDGETFKLGGPGLASKGDFSRQGEDLDPLSEPGLARLLTLAAWAPEIQISEKNGELEVVGNPTDLALAVAAKKAGAPAMDASKIEVDLPFSSARKMACLVIRDAEGELDANVRGAPEMLLDRCTTYWTKNGPHTLDDAARDRFKSLAIEWGGDAMRVVALASRRGPVADSSEWEKDLTLVGLVAIVDPPRQEVKAAIEQAQAAGIKTVMITGDHPATAKAIADQLGLCSDEDLVLTGPELDMLDQQQLKSRVDRIGIVARATPLHKLRMVEALKEQGRICAMTGDGVNDAPAVKAASIGVAMGKSGTEVTKEAADLVLADDNYATIVAAVEEGRAIFANIRKFILFLLSSNAGIVFVVFVAGLMGWAPPLVPIQILWINLVTNGLPALALGVEDPEPNLMSQAPRDPRVPILTRREYWSMFWVGALMSAASLGVFAMLVDDPSNPLSPNLRLGQTAAFAVLSFSPMFHAFNCRSAKASNFKLGWLSNRSLWGAVFIGICLMALAIYVPVMRPVFRTEVLDAKILGIVAILSSLPLIVGEVFKLIGAKAKS